MEKVLQGSSMAKVDGGVWERVARTSQSKTHGKVEGTENRGVSSYQLM